MKKRFARKVAVAAIAVAAASAIVEARLERAAKIEAAQLFQIATLTSIH